MKIALKEQGRSLNHSLNRRSKRQFSGKAHVLHVCPILPPSLLSLPQPCYNTFLLYTQPPPHTRAHTQVLLSFQYSRFTMSSFLFGYLCHTCYTYDSWLCAQRTLGGLEGLYGCSESYPGQLHARYLSCSISLLQDSKA